LVFYSQKVNFAFYNKKIYRIFTIFNTSNEVFIKKLIKKSETPPAGVEGFFWLQVKNELEPFGLPLYLQKGA